MGETNVTIKDKANPVKVWTGPGDTWRLMLSVFKAICSRRCSGCQPYALTAFTLTPNIPGNHSC
jgi:pyruvate-formate lyase-activating enzyme